VRLPADWTVDQAAAIDDLLMQLSEALWQLHGDALACRYARELAQNPTPPGPTCPVGEDDDIPF
jgi:hypothetical protein